MSFLSPLPTNHQGKHIIRTNFLVDIRRPSILHVLNDENMFGNRHPVTKTETNNTDFGTALAIVPPVEYWDRLQRARHYARDPVFHQWPPCLRLLHPFHGSTALDVASVVEELELEPFNITLDTWTIVPHLEALEAEWQMEQELPDVEDVEGFGNLRQQAEDQKVRELLLAEEEIGREKYEARRRRKAEKENIKVQDLKDENKPARVLEKQQRRYEEFGGPCILCLEPDEESKQRLMEFRETIVEFLDHSHYSSPSSVYSLSKVESAQLDLGYRPLVAISKFESLQAALQVARRLKGLWGEPLTWTVQDLHVMSCSEDGFEGVQKDEGVTDYVPKSSPDWNKLPWGCNAKIMLMGEEVAQDDELNEKMVQRLVEEGDVGGMDISEDFTILNDEEENISAIEQLLDDDDDYDAGTQVIIGRTHFFTGEQRVYSGMPASSAMDGKDRSMGQGHVVSAVARRRRSVSRKGNVWQNGDFGRREKDYSPWNKQERPKKFERFLNTADTEADQKDRRTSGK